MATTHTGIEHNHDSRARASVGPRRFVLIVLDGAGDRLRIDGRSPLAMAHTPNLDAIARDGCTGLMTTLYPELPQESLVAHLGMFGWDPRVYYPGGRASSELANVPGVTLEPSDVVFRANLARVGGGMLESYNANSIDDAEAARLVGDVDRALRREFAEFELHHVDEYRALLVVRGAGVDPCSVACLEPHESEGLPLDVTSCVRPLTPSSRAFADRTNAYLARAAALLDGRRANALVPWGLSTALRLPSFASVTGHTGKSAIVGAMAFLGGISAAAGLRFVQVGTGRPDSDFAQKGRAVLELLRDGYEFVCCHVNAPDEASHLHDYELKVRCLDRIDREIVGPIFELMRQHPERVGGLFVVPDHYSNSGAPVPGSVRREIHSLDPVPFAVWNNRDRDAVASFDEDSARFGRYGAQPVSHLQLLDILGFTRIEDRSTSLPLILPTPGPALREAAL